MGYYYKYNVENIAFTTDYTVVSADNTTTALKPDGSAWVAARKSNLSGNNALPNITESALWNERVITEDLSKLKMRFMLT